MRSCANFVLKFRKLISSELNDLTGDKIEAERLLKDLWTFIPCDFLAHHLEWTSLSQSLGQCKTNGGINSTKTD